jgi:hypothetical protein
MNRPSKSSYAHLGYGDHKPEQVEGAVQSASKGSYSPASYSTDYSQYEHEADENSKGSVSASGNYGSANPHAHAGPNDISGAKPVHGGGLESSSSVAQSTTHAWSPNASASAYVPVIHPGTGSDYTLKTTATGAGS